MSRILLLVIMLINIYSRNAAIAADVPTMKDFAFGLTMETSAEGAIFEIPLPLDFYRGLTRSDQSDICVFNKHGEVVPYGIKRQKPDERAVPSMVKASVFPVPGEPDKGLEGLSLKVQKDSIGAAIHLDGSDLAKREQKIAAYLIDTTTFLRAVTALELEWEHIEDGFIGRVDVEGSDDLEHWSRLGEGGVIASLRYGEQQLVQNRVFLKPSRKKYIRISWPLSLQQVKLIGTLVELESEATEAGRLWVSVPPVEKRENVGEYLFTSPGPIPVDRVRLRLPQRNTLVFATLLSRDDEKLPWISVASGLLYDLRVQGEEIRNDVLNLRPSTDRHWMLRIAQSGGGLGHGLPEMEMGWLPQFLVFVARGDGPFTLAYGNAKHSGGDMHVDDLLAQFDNAHKGRFHIQSATIGTHVVLGGESRLTPSPSVNWKRLTLWSVLLLAVLLLAWMSGCLYKQMQSQNTRE